jgi:hypothetical protein
MQESAWVTDWRRMARSDRMAENLFEQCSALGAIVGVYWGYKHPATEVDPASCRVAGNELIGTCFSDGVVAAAMPYLIGAGVGALCGALVALVIVRGIRHRRRRRRSRRAAQHDAALTAPGRWIRARYSGRCAGCFAGIAIGDRIRHRPGHARCERCATAP